MDHGKNAANDKIAEKESFRAEIRGRLKEIEEKYPIQLVELARRAIEINEPDEANELKRDIIREPL